MTGSSVYSASTVQYSTVQYSGEGGGQRVAVCGGADLLMFSWLVTAGQRGPSACVSLSTTGTPQPSMGPGRLSRNTGKCLWGRRWEDYERLSMWTEEVTSPLNSCWTGQSTWFLLWRRDWYLRLETEDSLTRWREWWGRWASSGTPAWTWWGRWWGRWWWIKCE